MRYGICMLALAVALAGCKVPVVQQNLPPAQRILEPGPGVGGPGPGVMMYPPPSAPVPPVTSQIAFVGPEGMVVNWDVAGAGMFDSEPLVVPGRYNFPQGALYRLKVTNIPGRPGVELYPTLEIGPTMPRTAAFLAHNAIPIQLTSEDFDQVLSGNFVTKVIYLPDPEFQQLAVAGVSTLVSTRLDPGVDPIVEADRQGAILAIVRLGNKDLQVPGSGGEGGAVMPASYGMPVAGGALLPGYVTGMTAPQYGMPITGTPIGLPGPPHVPLGFPAGLQKHTIVNHTLDHYPGPTDHVRIDVKQRPGMSYPAPANHVRIVENTNTGGVIFRQPLDSAVQHAAPAEAGGTGAPCPTADPPAASSPGPAN